VNRHPDRDYPITLWVCTVAGVSIRHLKDNNLLIS